MRSIQTMAASIKCRSAMSACKPLPSGPLGRPASADTSCWRCYCGTPPFAYRLDGSKRAAWPGQVFLVFVNRELIAYNWRWEQASADDPALSLKHVERFKRRIL